MSMAVNEASGTIITSQAGPGTSPGGSSGSTGAGGGGTPPARAGGARTGPSAIRVAGAALGRSLLQGAFAVVVGLLRAKLDQSVIDNQLENWKPIIAESIHGQKDLIAALQLLGQKAYANVLIGIVQYEIIEPGMPSIRSTTLPAVSLEMVRVSSIDENYQSRNGVNHAVGYKESERYFMYSVELPPLPQAEIDEWKRLTREVDDLESALSNLRLSTEARTHFNVQWFAARLELERWKLRD